MRRDQARVETGDMGATGHYRASPDRASHTERELAEARARREAEASAGRQELERRAAQRATRVQMPHRLIAGPEAEARAVVHRARSMAETDPTE